MACLVLIYSLVIVVQKSFIFHCWVEKSIAYDRYKGRISLDNCKVAIFGLVLHWFKLIVW